MKRKKLSKNVAKKLEELGLLYELYPEYKRPNGRYVFELTKKKKTEQLIGITPEESEKISLFSKYRDTFTIYKSAKHGQNSFRITKSLLDSLIKTSIQIQKKPNLIISIVDGSDEYTITCQITKK